MTTSRDLNALLGSRICHDLISPLGAIGNGVELLTLSGITAAPEIALIAESVENANARIRFFRIAFGGADPDQSIAAAEIRSVLSDMGRGSRVRVDWTPQDDQRRTDVKLCFLLLQCFESAMAWGGDIRVSRQDDLWEMSGTTHRMKIDPDLWALLIDPDADVRVTSAHVQFPLVADAARRAGRNLSTDLGENRIRVTY